MRIFIGLAMVLSGIFLLVSAKQVSADSQRTRGSLLGSVPPGAVRIIGAGALILGALWLFYELLVKLHDDLIDREAIAGKPQRLAIACDWIVKPRPACKTGHEAGKKFASCPCSLAWGFGLLLPLPAVRAIHGIGRERSFHLTCPADPVVGVDQLVARPAGGNARLVRSPHQKSTVTPANRNRPIES
jgi:hypothetical protein